MGCFRCRGHDVQSKNGAGDIPAHHHRDLPFTVDYRKLNAATVTDGFPLPFTDSVLDTVAGHECYSFLNGFSGYNQIRMHPEDQEKIAFVVEWGVFIAEVMMFGLKTAPATFQRIITEIFHDYTPAFMQVFLDDFAMYGHRLEHMTQLRLCLD